MRPRPTVGLPSEVIPRGWVEAVGFVRISGRLCVSFPKVYDAWKDRLATDGALRVKHLILLVRVLREYGRSISTQMGCASEGFVSNNPGMLDWLEAACELYEDFQSNGLYWTKQSQMSDRATSGAIAWSKTLSSVQPYMIDEAPIYLAVVRRNRSRTNQDLLHRIHARAINEIAEALLGRRAFLESQYLDDIDLGKLRSGSPAIFKSLARITYTDRGKYLLKLLMRYFEFADTERSRPVDGSLLCSSEAFGLVWEHMLRATVQNYDRGNYLRMPSGEWRSQGDAPSRGIAPKPDFGFMASIGSEKRLAIFDAKDKPVSLGERSGTEQDHYKQIVYRMLGKFASPVWNALVFPSVDLVGDGGSFVALGSHVWADHPGTMVHEIAADYPTVCQAFLAGRRLDPTPVLCDLALG
ncbi:LlaJI family restriction endonuclease [Erythrobacter sp. R86502]|uniref:LlaJI family restriction endonuclease n=1 Tax=Erythrobacter sp. R86502 TaxID=3093846 RepID=UPI0036D272A9